MNISFKHLSLSIVITALCIGIDAQGMFIKKLSKKTVSLKHYSSLITPYPYEHFKTLQEAMQALNHRNWQTQASALHFLNGHIAKNQDIGAIAKIANNLLTAPEKFHTSGRTKESALHLFIALANHNHELESALVAATSGILVDEPEWVYVTQTAVDLFDILLQKKHPQVIESATKTAATAFMNEKTRSGGLKLFKTLFKHNAGFEIASQIAQQVSVHHEDFRGTKLQLLQALVEKNYAFDIAEEIAMQWVASPIPSIQAIAFILFIDLVNKNYAIESARQAIDFASSGDQCLTGDSKLFCDELKDLCLEKTKQSNKNDVTTKKSAVWMELDIDKVKDIPLCSPYDPNRKPDPALTMLPGEERKFFRAMCELMDDGRDYGDEE